MDDEEEILFLQIKHCSSFEKEKLRGGEGSFKKKEMDGDDFRIDDEILSLSILPVLI